MTTLTAYYDLRVGPVSFDFVVFCVKAKMAAARVNATRLHIVIVPYPEGVGGMFRNKTQLYDEAEMRWRLWNICIPACQLFGASVTLATDWLQAKRLASEKDWKCWPDDWDRQTLENRRHLVGDIITDSKAAQFVPKPRASEHALRKVAEWFSKLPGRVVTMTLRSTYLDARNSDAKVWDAARWKLADMGLCPIVITDTGTALAAGKGYAELNIDLRMAMYEQAWFNLQSNNGTASLCWFSDARYAMFGAGVPADEWDGLFVRQGLPLGETWPWATRGQKLVYGAVTSDQLVEACKEWDLVTN